MHAVKRAALIGLLGSVAQVAVAAPTLNCTVSAGGIAFGIYNPLATAGDASTGSLRVTCSGSGSGSGTSTVNVGVTLSAGLSGSYATRKMLSGISALNYNIFWSTAYSQIVGDGSGGSFAGTAGPFTVYAGSSNYATGTLYGFIPAQQDVAPGSYSDVITVTVTY